MFRQRQAALVEGHQLGRTPQDLRIGQLQRLRLLAVTRGIDYENPACHAGLRCGETNADRAVHRLEQIVHQLSDFAVDRRHRTRLDLEPGIGSGDYRKLGHVEIYVSGAPPSVNIASYATRSDMRYSRIVARSRPLEGGGSGWG